MTFDTAQDLSSQVVSIPVTSFGMLMNSPHSEFQRISPQKRRSHPESSRVGFFLQSWRFIAFEVRIVSHENEALQPLRIPKDTVWNPLAF
jgi:hypothetical protein